MKKTLLICLLLAACKTVPPPSTETTPTTDGPPLQDQWFVWTGSNNSFQTTWLTAGDDGVEVLGTADSVWVGVGESQVASVWEFDHEVASGTQTDCECVFEAEQAGGDSSRCTSSSEFTTGVLRPFPTGPVIGLPPRNEIGAETQSISPTIDGSIGPFVFVTVCVDEYSCGAAHGNATCTQQIYDLRTGAEIDDYAMSASPLRGPEMLAFVREAYDDEIEAESLAEEDVVFSWVAPSYENGAVPRMEEQYTGPACYACSDGYWDSYTISTRRTVDALPKEVETWLETTAAPPADFMKEHAKSVRGWSAVPKDAALRGQLEASLGGRMMPGAFGRSPGRD